MNSKYKKRFLIFFSVFALLIIAFFIARQPILDYVLKKVKAKVKDRFHAELVIGDAHFNGLREISIDQVALIPIGRDTLLTLKHASAKIRISKLLIGKITTRELIVQQVAVTLMKKDSMDNYSMFLKGNSKKD